MLVAWVGYAVPYIEERPQRDLQGTLRVFGVWSCVFYLGRIYSAGFHGTMSDLLADSARLATGPDPSGSVGHLPVPSGFKPLWCLCGSSAVQVLLTGSLNVSRKSPGGWYVQTEPLGLRVGDLWGSWSCAPHCLEMPRSLQTPYTERTFEQAPGTVLSLQVPCCHL